MSLITSCPACGTMFRVVPDQLKISEGWVRCGHCGNVFEATAYLTDESVLDPARDEPAARVEPPASPSPAVTRGIPEPDDMPPPASAFLVEAQPSDPEPGEPPVPARSHVTAPPDEPTSSFFGTDSQSLEPSPLDSPFVFRRSDLVADDGDSSILPPPPSGQAAMAAARDARAEERNLEEREEREDATAAEIENVSFVRQARRKAFWRQPLVRVLLGLAALALAALLALQVAWQERDRLAVLQPALEPALAAMCDVLQCRLGAPRQIESVVIESSAFNRLRNDTYRLAFTVRNTAGMPVAVPSMELTLTDPQDQPVLRRVLAPAELGMRDAALPAAGEWSGAVGLQLAANGGSRVAGYRLLAFYP